MKFSSFLLASATSIFVLSCSTDSNSPQPSGDYDNGILVVNEGNSASGSISYFSNDLSVAEQDIFSLVNGSGESLGGFVQSMFFDGDRAFIISNGSNKITVVNRYTFEYLATIDSGFAAPRYGVVYGGKAYVTNMNSFFDAADDYVAVINLGDLSMAAPISVGTYAERIVESNGKLFVSGGAFGMGDKITVINGSTDTLVGSVTVGEAPNSLEVRDGILYVLCGSFTSNSKIVKINTATNAVESEIVFPDTMGNASNLDIDSDQMYFTVGPKIFKFDVDATSITNTPLADTGSTSFYIGYGFAVHDGRIFISEAADDFASDGSIFVYSTDGSLIDTRAAGLGPNGFYFN